MKKFLSIILTILMIVSSVPFAFATEGTPVAKVGDVEYTDFVTAVANWTDGTTLTLLADTPEYTDDITIVNKSVTLDLNGHTLNFSGTENKRFMVGEYDSLTIRDSGTDGAINAYYCTVQNYGITNLQSGTLNGPVSNVGTFNMTGGKVIGYSKLHRTSTQAIDNHGTLNISGGEATGRFGISANYESVTNISGSPVITGEDRGSNKGSAIRSASTDLIITISGTPTLTGGSWGELFSNTPITLNTQPADGETWRVFGTANSITANKGVFAIPGEGVTLNPEKFVSLTEGYTVKKNVNGELVFCDCANGLVFVSNGDGTHNTTCSCGSATFDTNLACSGGVATDTLQAYCEYCNAPYGELNPDVHYDITALTMTAEELESALLELLNAGETDISILLAAEPSKDMFTAINTALRSSTAADGSISLTLGGVKTIPKCYFMGNGYLETSKNTDVCEVKTITLPDATTLEVEALSYCRNLEAVYLPKVTNFGIWALDNCENLNTVVLSASGTITADFFNLQTESIDLVLNCDKKNDVTNENEWQGVTWKSISFAHNYTDGTCTDCGYECPHESITESVCDICGYVEKFSMRIYWGGDKYTDFTVPYGANLMEVITTAEKEGKLLSKGDEMRIVNDKTNGIYYITGAYSFRTGGYITNTDTMPANDIEVTQTQYTYGWVATWDEEDNVRWRYSAETGTLNEGWHYIEEDYDDVDGGARYYLEPVTTYFGGTLIVRAEGITEIDGKRYYFDELGRFMESFTGIHKGYYFENGVEVVTKAVDNKDGTTHRIVCAEHENCGVVFMAEEEHNIVNDACGAGCGYEYDRPADPTPDTPDEPDVPDEPGQPEEDGTICEYCRSNHNNPITRIFCRITQFFIRLFTFLGFWE